MSDDALPIVCPVNCLLAIVGISVPIRKTTVDIGLRWKSTTNWLLRLRTYAVLVFRLTIGYVSVLAFADVYSIGRLRIIGGYHGDRIDELL